MAPGAGERVQGPAGLVPMGVGALALVYHLQDCDHDPVSSEVGVWWAVGAPACLLPACGLLPLLVGINLRPGDALQPELPAWPHSAEVS